MLKFLCITFFIFGYLLDHIAFDEELDPEGGVESAAIYGSFVCYAWSLTILLFGIL